MDKRCDNQTTQMLRESGIHIRYVQNIEYLGVAEIQQYAFLTLLAAL